MGFCREEHMEIYQVLKTYFGYDEFKTGQEKLVKGVASGKDVLGIMPTGGGKSLCYQLPAITLEGITIVISPLIALMKDQVDSLNEMGIAGTYINSSLEQNELNIRLNEINTKSKDDTIKGDRDTIQKLLKEIEELKSSNVVNKLKNERGAGRKEMFTEEQKARVKMLRLQGKSYRAIAKDMNCSVATVHKIINEQ